MDEFNEIKSIDDLKNIFIPKVERFSDLIDELLESNDENKEVIKQNLASSNRS